MVIDAGLVWSGFRWIGVVFAEENGERRVCMRFEKLEERYDDADDSMDIGEFSLFFLLALMRRKKRYSR